MDAVLTRIAWACRFAGAMAMDDKKLRRREKLLTAIRDSGESPSPIRERAILRLADEGEYDDCLGDKSALAERVGRDMRAIGAGIRESNGHVPPEREPYSPKPNPLTLDDWELGKARALIHATLVRQDPSVIAFRKRHGLPFSSKITESTVREVMGFYERLAAPELDELKILAKQHDQQSGRSDSLAIITFDFVAPEPPFEAWFKDGLIQARWDPLLPPAKLKTLCVEAQRRHLGKAPRAPRPKTIKKLLLLLDPSGKVPPDVQKQLLGPNRRYLRQEAMRTIAALMDSISTDDRPHA
jgi:hypothetical protein